MECQRIFDHFAVEYVGRCCCSCYICTMYSRQEASQRKQEFWTTFGQYMTPLRSAEGEKVNWVNYKTGEKDIFFRMQTDTTEASIAIVLTQKDDEIRLLYFEQFIQVRKVFFETVGSDWLWEQNAVDSYGRPVSRIILKKEHVSVLKKEDWPELISFFKKGILALDEFWSQVKYGFESLR